MRTIGAVAIGIILLSAWQSNPSEDRPPTMRQGSAIIRQVFRINSPNGGLFVHRPLNAVPDTDSTVFLVEGNGKELRRVPVRYGRLAPPLIQIVSGLSAGDRIVISDMSAWDQIEHIRTQ